MLISLICSSTRTATKGVLTVHITFLFCHMYVPPFFRPRSPCPLAPCDPPPQSLASPETSFLQLDAVPTGNVADLKRRLQEARAKDTSVQGACNAQATLARSTKEGQDDQVKKSAVAKADEVYQTTEAAATEAKAAVIAKANKPKQDAGLARDQAQTAKAAAGSAYATSQGALEAAKQAQVTGTTSAKAEQTQEAEAAKAVRKAAVDDITATAKLTDGAALTAKTTDNQKVDTACTAQLKTLADEVSLVKSIRQKMGTVNLVGKDEADALKAREEAKVKAAADKAEADRCVSVVARVLFDYALCLCARSWSFHGVPRAFRFCLCSQLFGWPSQCSACSAVVH